MITATVKGETTRYSHDANGNLVSTLHPSGILDERSYDAAGRLTKIKGKGSHGRFFYIRSYTYDAAGNPLTQKAVGPRSHSHGWWGKVWLHRGHHALARWQESYSYDSLNRLTKACMNESCSHYFAYSYDPVGNRTKLETKKSTTSYSYDAADELTSASKLEHRKTELTSYAYDANGNQTQEGSTHYSYNLENKLTQVVDRHEQVSYTYTGEGLMNTRSTRSETTSYSWDTSSELPELALETTSKGQGRHVDTDTTAYTYGAGPIGTETRRGSYTFHTDALGSVIGLSDERGKLAQSYRYTPYGESYGPGQSGDAEVDSLNAMRFAGQYLDSESDLYNMRAREYQPETGRFLEVDPIEAGAGDTYLGTYVYAADQPTLKTDPSGMCPNKNQCSSAQKKSVRVTFYVTGSFSQPPPKAGPGATWKAEKISKKNWLIVQRKDAGWAVSGKGPNWLYDDTNPTHESYEPQIMQYYALLAKFHSVTTGGSGYVFVAAHGGWAKIDPPFIPVTRHYVQLYKSDDANPANFSGWEGKGAPTVAVRLSRPFDDRPTDDQAGRYVHYVCSKVTTTWMGIWAGAPGLDGQPTKVKKIKEALNKCSRGEPY